MTERFRYIIIGGGMMGAAAARHLSKWTDGVALIGPHEPADYQRHEGVFASHYDEARITRTIDPDAAWARLANRSIERYGEIASESGIDFYSEVGCLIVGQKRADAPGYISSVLDAAGRLDVETEILDDAALSGRFSYFSFPEGSEGVWEARHAGYVNPRRLVRAQEMIAQKQGVARIAETVSAVRQEGDAVTVTTAEGSSFTADRVLVAAGGFSINENLLPRRINLEVYARTVAFFEIDAETAQAMKGMPSLIWKWEHEEGIYLLPPVTYPDGRTYLKIGGDPDDILLGSEPEIRAWFKSGGRQSIRQHLTEVMKVLMPSLDLSRSSMAACVTSFTPTDYPAIAMTQADRIGVLTGGCGAAAKSSDEIGRLGAELMLHGRIVDDAYASMTDFRADYL